MPAAGPALLGRGVGGEEESRSRGKKKKKRRGEPQLPEAVATASTALLRK